MLGDTLEIFEADGLKAEGVAHAFFSRRGGVSTGIYAGLNAGPGSADDAAAVAENRRRIAGALGVLPGHLISMHQIHSADAIAIDAPPAARPKLDGLATRTPGLALSALHADCAPVLFADPKARVIGACHAGWRGATGGVLEATLLAMERLGAKSISAAIGPTIGPQSYEVGPEFPGPIVADWGEAARFFRPSAKAGHHMFDLPAYILARLQRAGAIAENLGRDTYGAPDTFYSYRRATHRGEADYGRLLSAIVLTE
ncbi:MAG: peptidoglycan editing factor PgeF [Pseudomonadota bacterium]